MLPKAQYSSGHKLKDSEDGLALQATQAYLVGNKALAKELGGKGRQQSDLMKAAHAAASENIFQQRNMRSASSVVSNKNGATLPSCNGSMHEPVHQRAILRITLQGCTHCMSGVGHACRVHLHLCRYYLPIASA